MYLVGTSVVVLLMVVLLYLGPADPTDHLFIEPCKF